MPASTDNSKDRLDRITTGAGDDGYTALVGGQRLPKFHPRLEAIGALDELNAALGVTLAELPVNTAWHLRLVAVQHDLFDLGGELAMPPPTALLSQAHCQRLESWQADWQTELPALRNFLLPGGSRAVALLQWCRTVCRRAERRLVALSADSHSTNPHSLVYLNRLSDLLFVASRALARERGEAEALWQQNIHDRLD